MSTIMDIQNKMRSILQTTLVILKLDPECSDAERNDVIVCTQLNPDWHVIWIKGRKVATFRSQEGHWLFKYRQSETVARIWDDVKCRTETGLMDPIELIRLTIDADTEEIIRTTNWNFEF